MDFKPNVIAALEKICTPFKMNETMKVGYGCSIRDLLYSSTIKNDSLYKWA
jgi:hypothetical protein